MTLVHGQGHVGQVAQDEDQLLTKDVHTEAIGTSFEPLEGLLHGEQGLQRSGDKDLHMCKMLKHLCVCT